jgi:cytochrome c biogenesis protein CcmG/thiol:disulfide interchange protein DsbE
MSEGEDAGEQAGRQDGFRFWMLIPALGALAVLGAMGWTLMDRQAMRAVGSNPDDLRSMLLDQPAPEFEMAALAEGAPDFTTAELKTGEVTLVNFWASWCVPCRVEHPVLMALAEEGVTIYGINYRDTNENAQRFLDELGDPFAKVGVDPEGRQGVEWGVYGIPETFVIDGRGRIVYKKLGPFLKGDIETKIRPAIEAAKAATAPPPAG